MGQALVVFGRALQKGQMSCALENGQFGIRNQPGDFVRLRRGNDWVTVANEDQGLRLDLRQLWRDVNLRPILEIVQQGIQVEASKTGIAMLEMPCIRLTGSPVAPGLRQEAANLWSSMCSSMS